MAALAILVVLGAAGGVMLRLTSLQQSGSSAAILGTRANWAARSGIDWAIHRAVSTGGCPAPASTLNLSEGALSGFSVVVTCSATTHREGSLVRTSLVIESVAQYGTAGSTDYVFRDVRASIVL
jgi:MSHA biogenesis protein MshP